MTVDQIINGLRSLTGNRYFMATDAEMYRELGYVLIHEHDLDRIDEVAMTRFLDGMKWDMTDKGIVVYAEPAPILAPSQR